ncbi:MAG: IclR family transcriptional regulator [Pseudochelatococcus sp.]|jgi:IclR family acetate operon transcriptional repressor|uniref:IclR family transcriptional regulator n=1 Tax=Pseudochelatococcus sp. TaxID=2020869 RepID=UPI003D930AC7
MTVLAGGTNRDESAPSNGAAAPGVVHNQSVLKAVALIGCFVDSAEGKTLTELARHTGMNVSTAYRMLQTLTLTGVLRRNDGEERYFVGPMLLALAGSTFSSNGYGIALDVLRALSEETGESASLGIRDGDCVVVLLSSGSSQQLRFMHRAGERIPIHCSAMGKALLASRGINLAQAVAGLGRLHPMTPHSICRTDVLLAELERIRQTGHAVEEEESHLGVRSLAMIAAGGDTARIAVGVQGPVSRMSAERMEFLLELLRNATNLVAKLPIMERLGTSG